MGRVIDIVAAIILDPQGRTLLVRKRGTTVFMQPGGKRVVGETLVDGLCREILEELGCRVDRDSAIHLGWFEAVAANELDARVHADLFLCQIDGAPRPMAEIAEILWLDPGQASDVVLAPLTTIHVLSRLSSGA